MTYCKTIQKGRKTWKHANFRLFIIIITSGGKFRCDIYCLYFSTPPFFIYFLYLFFIFILYILNQYLIIFLCHNSFLLGLRGLNFCVWFIPTTRPSDVRLVMILPLAPPLPVKRWRRWPTSRRLLAVVAPPSVLHVNNSISPSALYTEPGRKCSVTDVKGDMWRQNNQTGRAEKTRWPVRGHVRNRTRKASASILRKTQRKHREIASHFIYSEVNTQKTQPALQEPPDEEQTKKKLVAVFNKWIKVGQIKCRYYLCRDV